MKSSITLIIFIIIAMISGSLWAQDDFEYVSSSLFHDAFGAIIKRGDYTYCGGANGIQIFDVSNLSYPTFIKNCDYPGNRKMIVAGQYMYAINAIGDKTLRIFDVSDTLNPSLISSYQTDYGTVVDLAVRGNYAYLAAESLSYDFISYIDIIDISNPYSPVHRNAINTFIVNGGMHASNGYLYVLSSWEPVDPSSLRIYDLANPVYPILVSITEFPEFCCGTEVFVSGGYAFLVGYMGLLIADISDPENPELVEIYDLFGLINMFIHGDIAYLAAYGEIHDEIHAVNISDPANPEYLGNFEWEGEIGPLIVDDHIVYFAGYDSRYDNAHIFGIVDFSDPGSPESTGLYYVPGAVRDVQLYEEFAFIANRYSGLQAIDIGDPYNPLLGINIDTDGYALDIFISGHVAFVANLFEGLTIFDISEPAAPDLVGSYVPEDAALYVCAEGDYAYLIVAREGLYDHHILILDISDTSNPILVNTYVELNIPRYIRVVDDIAYVACSYSLEIVDMTDPTAPVRLASHPYGHSGTNLFVHEEHVYVAAWSNGLEIFDVSDPENPLLVGMLDSLGASAGAVAVSDGYAYLSSYNGGLYLVDVSDPTQPTLVSSYPDASPRNEVFIRGEYIYVAAEDCFLILRLTPTGLEQVAVVYPSTLDLIQNYPNPFNASTLIRYSLPQASDVRITIYDILGRRVETLVQGEQPAGYHQITWDARDQSSGMYFYKIQAGEYSETKKMVLLK